MKDDYHRWIAFTDEQIENIINEFRGIYINPTTGQEERRHEPLMNEEGIATARVLLRSVLTHNTILSNITKDEFQRVFVLMLSDFLTTILLNREKYDIKIENIQTIMSIFTNYVEFALRRAINQGEREFVKATLIAKRQVIEGQQQPSTIPYYDEQMEAQPVEQGDKI